MSYKFTTGVGNNSDPLWTSIGGLPDLNCQTNGGITFLAYMKRTDSGAQSYSVRFSIASVYGNKFGFRVNTTSDSTFALGFSTGLSIQCHNNWGYSSYFINDLDLALVQDRWSLIAYVCTPTDNTLYIIDASDGQVLYKNIDTQAAGLPASIKGAGATRIERYDDFTRAMYIAEEAILTRPFTEQELSDFAQVGFVEKNLAASDVYWSREYMTGDVNSYYFSTDNPVDVMEINPISNTYDSVTYTTFSVLTAPLRIALIDSSAINSYDFVNIWSADISDPNIYGLVDITSTAAVYEEITFSGLPTNTSFKLLIAHDAANGSLGFVEETYTITSKLCQFNLGDVTGAAHNNLTDISWAFFDETSTDALGAPLQSGVDSADANGQLNLSIDDMRASDNGKLVLSQGTNKTAHYDVTLL